MTTLIGTEKGSPHKRKVRMRKIVPTEHQIQCALIEWRDLMVSIGQHVELRWLFAIPNGGLRHKATAANLKREGVLKGVPDLFLPVARGGFHGLFLELKRPGGKLTQEQTNFLLDARRAGYAAHIAYSFEEAQTYLQTYIRRALGV